jgi:hypothetical protein
LNFISFHAHSKVFFLELRIVKRFPPKFKLIVHSHTNKILELLPKMTHLYYVFTLDLAFLIPNLELLNGVLPILFPKYLCTCGYLWNHLQVLEDQRYHKILSIYISIINFSIKCLNYILTLIVWNLTIQCEDMNDKLCILKTKLLKISHK